MRYSQVFWARYLNSSPTSETALQDPALDTIVGGVLYPSCVACHGADKKCEWQFVVVGLRMLGVEHTELRCELCRADGNECAFAWGIGDSLRAIDDVVSRLARHARSQYNTLCKQAEEHASAREAVEKGVDELAGV